MTNPIISLAREISDALRLFDEKNKRVRRLVILSEKDIYYQYFEGLINYIIENSTLEICYITADFEDPILGQQNPRIHTFYIKHGLSMAMSRLDSQLVVMTMPDLDNYYIKRSPLVGKYIYKFHAIVSTHQQYRSRAFDNYDTIFCVGPHHVEEIRKTEQLGKLPSKQLIESGYHRLEKIYLDHQDWSAKNQQRNEKKIVLVAPSWGPSSLLEAHLKEVISAFEDTPYTVLLRPHPQSVLADGGFLETIRKSIASIPNISLESDLLKQVSIHQADVLVTDRSGIAFEYAFGTERPVLFVDTPLKRSNPDCDQLDIEPMENRLRDEIGVRVPVSEIATMPERCLNFETLREHYRSKINDARQRCIFNWLDSSRVEGDYVLSLLKDSH